MRNLITRQDKKKLRAIILCHTGNPECRKSTYSKTEWLFLKNKYKVWFKMIGLPGGMEDRKIANTVKK